MEAPFILILLVAWIAWATFIYLKKEKAGKVIAQA
jgi:hypothetical protein